MAGDRLRQFAHRNCYEHLLKFFVLVVIVVVVVVVVILVFVCIAFAFARRWWTVFV